MMSRSLYTYARKRAFLQFENLAAERRRKCLPFPQRIRDEDVPTIVRLVRRDLWYAKAWPLLIKIWFIAWTVPDVVWAAKRERDECGSHWGSVPYDALDVSEGGTA